MSTPLWRLRIASSARYEDGDLDFDGDVDLNDLAEMVGLYGTICE